MALKGRQGLPKPLPLQHGGSLVRGAEVLSGFRRQEKEPCTGAVSPEGMDIGVGAGNVVPAASCGALREEISLPSSIRNSVPTAIVSVASKLSCCLAMTPPALDSKPVALTAPRNLHQVFNSLHQMGIYKMAALSLP